MAWQVGTTASHHTCTANTTVAKWGHDGQFSGRVHIGPLYLEHNLTANVVSKTLQRTATFKGGLSGDNCDGDNFGKGEICHLQES